MIPSSLALHLRSVLAVLFAVLFAVLPVADGPNAQEDTEESSAVAVEAESSSATEPAAAESSAKLPLTFKNSRSPREGVTSGGQPTADELRRAAELGYRTVINLRTGVDRDRSDFDEAALVQSLGMHYVSLPVAGGQGITSENANSLDRLLAGVEGPVLLHCASGNRIGALFALVAHELEGKDAGAALQAGLDSGLRGLEPVVRKKLGLPEKPAAPKG